MEGTEFTVALAPGDAAALRPGALEAAAAERGRQGLRLTVVGDAAVPPGGALARDAAGRQIWDNRLAARLERFWPELRLRAAVTLGFARPPRAANAGEKA
jgi:vacuolar-type H+-ATPase subunit E/Vma4